MEVSSVERCYPALEKRVPRRNDGLVASGIRDVRVSQSASDSQDSGGVDERVKGGQPGVAGREVLGDGEVERAEMQSLNASC